MNNKESIYKDLRSTDWKVFSENNQCNLIRIDLTSFPATETWQCAQSIEFIRFSNDEDSQGGSLYLGFFILILVIVLLILFLFPLEKNI